MSGSIPPLPQYAFIAWCSVKTPYLPMPSLGALPAGLHGVMLRYREVKKDRLSNH
jgi:hypothetical protein